MAEARMIVSHVMMVNLTTEFIMTRGRRFAVELIKILHYRPGIDPRMHCFSRLTSILFFSIPFRSEFQKNKLDVRGGK